MKKCFVFFFVLFLGAFFMSPTYGSAKKDSAKKAPAKKVEVKHTSKLPIDVYYKGGVVFATKDKRFETKFGGRIMWDLFYGSETINMANAGNDFVDGTEFRRVRFYNSGKLYKKKFSYKLQFDFAGGNAVLKDAYIGFHLPGLKKFLNIKVGHFKEPFGLEESGTSSKYITFIERAGNAAFAPSRNDGVMLYGNPTPALVYALGFFRETNKFGMLQQEGGYNFSARVAMSPIYNKKQARVVHIGFGYSYRNSLAKYEIKAPAHLSPKILKSGTLNGDSNAVDFELALVFGPLSFQTELMAVNVNVPGVSNESNYWGYYLYVSYFLTGEHRNYKRSSAGFGRVHPKKNFMENGGMGAIELGLRFSEVYLKNPNLGATDDNAYDITFGVNWYLTPNIRIMANYVWGYQNGGRKKHYDVFVTRFQIDF